VIVEPALWFVMARSVMAGHRRWLLADAIVATGAAVALIGLIGFAMGHSVITTEGVRRLASIYPSPDNLGLLLDRIVPVAAGVALFGLGRRRLWYGGATIPMLLAALLTFSKGSWLALAAAGLVLGIRHRTIAIASAIVIVALVGAAIALPVTRVRLLGATSMERVWLWQSSVTMIRDHPVFGIGLDQFLYTYPRYRLANAWREPFLSHPHNLVLDVWLTLGLAGLAWLGWTMYRILERLRRLATSAVGDERALLAGLGAGFAAALAHGMVDNALFLPDLAILFWAFLVLLDGPLSTPVQLAATSPTPIMEDRLVTVG